MTSSSAREAFPDLSLLPAPPSLHPQHSSYKRCQLPLIRAANWTSRKILNYASFQEEGFWRKGYLNGFSGASGSLQSKLMWKCFWGFRLVTKTLFCCVPGEKLWPVSSNLEAADQPLCWRLQSGAGASVGPRGPVALFIATALHCSTLLTGRCPSGRRYLVFHSGAGRLVGGCAHMLARVGYLCRGGKKIPHLCSVDEAFTLLIRCDSVNGSVF